MTDRKSALYPPYHPVFKADLQPVPKPAEEYAEPSPQAKEDLRTDFDKRCDARYQAERARRLAEGAPTDPAPSEHARRKGQPVARGVLDYFPDALLAVAEVSRKGQEQHELPELFWAFDKSTDHADCLARHFLDRGTLDKDGMSHTAKVAWRALALLQTELEKADPELHAKREELRGKAAKGER